jgi:23S rRNA pseudouridine1911/1915/1917 synthase
MSAAQFRWVVGVAEPLGALLGRHGLSGALGDGRVFVDGKRTSTDAVLGDGSVVEVFAPRPRADIQLLWEGEDTFAVHKPAALPTEPDHAGQDCVLAQLARLLRVEVGGLFAISRLDVGVSGVLLVTLGSRSRERLLAERAAGRLRRRYVALTCGVPAPAAGEWNEALGKARVGKRVVDGRDAQAARTLYQVVATAGSVARGEPPSALLALSPVTGRTHQLRVHASAHGAPIFGDRKYGGPPRLTGPDGSVRSFPQILLHAAWVEWGREGKSTRVISELAEPLCETWQSLNGELSALERALSVRLAAGDGQ